MVTTDSTSPKLSWDQIDHWLKIRSFELLQKADAFSLAILDRCNVCIADYLKGADLDPARICIVVIGSVGRREALAASDLDLIPILKDDQTAAVFAQHDSALRSKLRTELKIKVSKGADLTKFTSLSQLVQDDTIGGERDDSSALTKRILILSESAQGGGSFALRDVRRAILEAYSAKERTSGSHVLSFCNDLARYYRTLCIEYKAKIDVEAKDWATRNMKLRHSRKVWYFTTMLSMVTLAEKCPRGQNDYQEALLNAFELSPCLRMADVVATHPRSRLSAARILECYSMFLEFMADTDRRQALENVTFNERYKIATDNPFLAIKFNSDLLHSHILTLIESLDVQTRHRMFDWFLF